MKYTFSLLGIILVLISNTMAHDYAEVEYNLQPSQQVIIEDTREVTLYRAEHVDSTFIKNEPYQVRECGNEVRYRSECSWVPGRNVCRTVRDSQCRDIRRTRRECTTVRGRRECVSEPARRVCRSRNGVQRCTNVPGRERCRNLSGSQVCREVPYMDRDCRNVSRQVCDWAPRRNICSDIPYTENVCRNVTRYREVSYSCKKPVQIPYQAEKLFSYIVDLKFIDVDQLGRAKINFFLDNKGELKINYKNDNQTESYMQLLRDRKSILVDSNEEIKINREIAINFGNLNTLTAPIKSSLNSLWMNKEGEFKLQVSNPDAFTGSTISIKVTKRNSGDLHFYKALNFTEFSSSRGQLSVDLSRYGFAQLRGLFGRSIELKVDVGVVVAKPVNLLSPIDMKFEKKKSFNIKVYKNK